MVLINFITIESYESGIFIVYVSWKSWSNILKEEINLNQGALPNIETSEILRLVLPEVLTFLSVFRSVKILFLIPWLVCSWEIFRFLLKFSTNKCLWILLSAKWCLKMMHQKFWIWQKRKNSYLFLWNRDFKFGKFSLWSIVDIFCWHFWANVGNLSSSW